MIQRDEATIRQIAAARPDVSTWLSANAGSGKTRVLTDRVARLLFNGTPPQRILCLTYTKAAASEMQNRLFARLGKWTMLPDDKLRKQLIELGVEEELTPDRLSWARTLFAAAIETPGGLKIQTVHAFCAGILRQFPLEAQVTPQFKEMDDTQTRALRDQVLIETVNDPIGKHTFERLVALRPKLEVSALLDSICSAQPNFASATAQGVAEQAGAPLSLTQDNVIQSFSDADLDLVDELQTALAAAEGSTTVKFAQQLRSLPRQSLYQFVAGLEDVVLTGKSAKVPYGAKNLGLIKKSDQDLVPHLLDPLCDLCARVENIRETRRRILLRDQSLVLLEFAGVYLSKYRGAKDLRGLLDFDDLILKTQSLLSDRNVAQWVLFRLDGGIDHILVDEAQDTSPTQWNVIKHLSEEFGSGEGAREDVNRTIFVVGDKKQSIYSFQGADPSGFDRMRDVFERRITDAGGPFFREELKHSFRSSAAILNLVDQIFAEDKEGLGEVSDHLAFKGTLPGRVDVWPVVEKTADPVDQSWDDPIDLIAGDDPASVLADQIAQSISHMIAHETLPVVAPNGTQTRRAITAGDILILVQGRTGIFQSIIAACKRYDIPIAGADRLKLSAELAVKDLIALLSFLALPEDDLALASVLRSPLFEWSEQDLFDLAHNRGSKFLWAALREQRETYPETLTVIEALRNVTDYNRPYEILEMVLGRFDGRKKLIGRLGPEAEEAIDALLAMALDYEGGSVPSLTGFLVWFHADEAEIKREAEGAGNKLRVMTVHGAKGLEAPIVFLPDTARRKPPNKKAVIYSDGQPLLSMANEDGPLILEDIKAAAARPAELEKDRLLYVALTRAESWLICCAAGEVGTTPACWYDKIDTAASALKADPLPTALGPGLRLEHGNWHDGELEQADDIPLSAAALEPFFDMPVTKIAPKPEPLSASDLGGPKALPTPSEDLSTEEAKQLGTVIHQLLEVLAQRKISPEDVANETKVLLETIAPHLPTDHAQRAVEECTQVMGLKEMQEVLAKNPLFEAECYLATDPGPGVSGVIDLLSIDEQTVTIYDYKTNRTVPTDAHQTPAGILRQMGAYVEAMRGTFPNHKVEAAIIWTATGQIMHLPHNLVSQALQDGLSA